MQAIITFFFVLNEIKIGGLHLDPTRFFHQPQESFISYGIRPCGEVWHHLESFQG